MFPEGVGPDAEKRTVQDVKDKAEVAARAGPGAVGGAGLPAGAAGLDRLTAWGGDIAEGDGLADESELLPAWEGVEVSGILPSMVANSEVRPRCALYCGAPPCHAAVGINWWLAARRL
jgi:hypothetical protein